MNEFLQIPVLGAVLTLFAYWIGTLVQKKWKNPLLNPILIGMVLVAVFLLVSGMDVSVYRAGSDMLTWLMTPATIALAIPMYEQFRILRQDLKAIALGVAAGTASCLIFLMVCGLAMKLDKTLVISVLPKSVTTAIGVPISELYGGIGAVTAAAIICTGVLTNMFGVTLCRIFGIRSPVAQGVAFGTAGHVVGTAKASEISPLVGAVSSLSLVVCGLLTAVFLPILTSFLGN